MSGGTLTAVCVGIAVGASVFTLGFAQAHSYLSDDPAACVNCHVMQAQYEGWLRGSHREVAGCNDCHAPDALLPKYAAKAWNGIRHSAAFTFGFHDPIRTTPLNRAITEAQCRTCHGAMVEGLDEVAGHRSALACTSCHAGVGHGD